MRIHTVVPDAGRPRHAPGEIVWAAVGNFLEDRHCSRKCRPVVILRVGDCQHWIAGLTTQASFKMTNEVRVLVPVHRDCRLCGQSYLWANYASRLCRLDVRSHIGWVNREVVDVLAKHMRLPVDTLAELRAATR